MKYISNNVYKLIQDARSIFSDGCCNSEESDDQEPGLPNPVFDLQEFETWFGFSVTDALIVVQRCATRLLKC